MLLENIGSYRGDLEILESGRFRRYCYFNRKGIGTMHYGAEKFQNFLERKRSCGKTVDRTDGVIANIRIKHKYTNLYII